MALFHSFLVAEQYSVAYVHARMHTHTHTRPFFIHTSVDEHLGCFHVLSIVSSAAIHIEVRVFF